MKLTRIAAGLLLSATLAPAYAGVIYSNLSAGQTYNDGTGFGLDNPYGSAEAVAFTPGAAYSLREIDIGVTHISGFNGVNVELLADASGFPGTLLHSWTLGNLPVFGTVHAIQASQTITGITGITLSAGTQYWLAVFPGSTASYEAWNNDNWPTSAPATPGNRALLLPGSPWSTGVSNGVGALEIQGDVVTAAVPEPETRALLLAGFGLMSFVARQRKRQAG